LRGFALADSGAPAPVPMASRPVLSGHSRALQPFAEILVGREGLALRPRL